METDAINQLRRLTRIQNGLGLAKADQLGPLIARESFLEVKFAVETFDCQRKRVQLNLAKSTVALDAASQRGRV